MGDDVAHADDVLPRNRRVRFPRRRGYAASGFANQFENAFKRAQEAPVLIEVLALSTAGERHRLARETSMS